MNNRWVFILSGAGLLAGAAGAWLLSEQHHPAPPVFQPAPNPYPTGLYATGIIESRQASGQNINVYPEVPGTVRQVLVKEGDHVRAGQVLMQLDDSVQRATTAQLEAQTHAAQASLQALQAQPRPETLQVSQAQLAQAQSALRSAEAPYRKLQQAFKADAGAVSRDTLDNAENQYLSAKAALELAQKQLDLVKAGAWAPDVAAQKAQLEAQTQAWTSAKAQLARYALRAPTDGVVLAVQAGTGAYAATTGVYSTYTGSWVPVLTLSGPQDELAVRCYVDEILIHKLPLQGTMKAQLSVRGTSLKVPLTFDHVQPYVTPKLSLSDQRQERVDLRVLPVVFSFKPPADAHLFPGQLVDVFIETGATAAEQP